MRHALASLLLLPCVCLAQFTPDYFNGNLQYEYGYDDERVWQCYSATVERATAGYGADNVQWSTSIYFGTVGELHTFKQALKANLLNNYWVDYRFATNGNFAGWFSNTNNTDFPRLTISNICEIVGLSTNWFDETSYYGAVTDTNGWLYFDDIISNMVWTAEDAATYCTLECGTNSAALYWMGDGTNNPTISTNIPSDDLVFVTNQCGRPVQFFDALEIHTQEFATVTNVWTYERVEYEAYGEGYLCDGTYLGEGFLDIFTFDSYYDCEENRVISAAELYSNAVASLPIHLCPPLVLDYGIVTSLQNPTNIFTLTRTNVCTDVPVAVTNYSLESEFQFSDVTFTNIGQILSEKTPYYKFQSPGGSQIIETNFNVDTNVFVTNLVISGSNAVYDACCPGDTFTWIAGYTNTYTTNIFNPTNITYVRGSIPPDEYSSKTFAEFDDATVTDTNAVFCDDRFGTNVLSAVSYSTNGVSRGFEVADSRLLIKWDVVGGFKY